MERKIGEIFEYDGEWYQCINTGNCSECAFTGKRCYDFSTKGVDIIGDCTGRTFKKLEKVGEPYMAHDHSRNKDVVVQDYKLYNQHACYNGREEMLCFGLYGRVGMVTIKSKEPIKSLNCENSVDIEIKQNKEDMEEKKLNLKPFDIQKAREGKSVYTRGGRKARIIYFDAKGAYPIVALIETGNGEKVVQYMIDGHCTDIISQCCDDLMMLPEKKEGWAKIRKDVNLYDTKEEADRKMIGNDEYVTAKVCWEE